MSAAWRHREDLRAALIAYGGVIAQVVETGPSREEIEALERAAATLDAAAGHARAIADFDEATRGSVSRENVG
jgi:hypothetical protein